MLGTLDACEAAEIVRRLKVGLLVMSPANDHVASDLNEIADAVIAAIPHRS
jgi:hypothetical protein